MRLETVEGPELESLIRYRDSVAAAQGAPTGVTELAEHIEKTLPALIDAANAVREEAAVAIAEQEDTWAPIAGRLMTWVNLERDARLSDDTVKALDAAKRWVAAHAAELRNQRLEPIAEQAREIWSELRQESNVDIGSISLEGSNTRRRAVLKGSVDGVPTEALAVMSQGSCTLWRLHCSFHVRPHRTVRSASSFSMIRFRRWTRPRSTGSSEFCRSCRRHGRSSCSPTTTDWPLRYGNLR